jgi:hypothetical protein
MSKMMWSTLENSQGGVNPIVPPTPLYFSRERSIYETPLLRFDEISIKLAIT